MQHQILRVLYNVILQLLTQIHPCRAVPWRPAREGADSPSFPFLEMTSLQSTTNYNSSAEIIEGEKIDIVVNRQGADNLYTLLPEYILLITSNPAVDKTMCGENRTFRYQWVECSYHDQKRVCSLLSTYLNVFYRVRNAVTHYTTHEPEAIHMHTSQITHRCSKSDLLPIFLVHISWICQSKCEHYPRAAYYTSSHSSHLYSACKWTQSINYTLAGYTTRAAPTTRSHALSFVSL